MIPGLELEQQPVPKGLEVEGQTLPRGLELDSAVPKGLEVLGTGLEVLTPKPPTQDHLVSDFASKLQPSNLVSPSTVKAPGKYYVSPKAGSSTEGTINQVEADKITDKSRLKLVEPGRYTLGPSKAEGIVKNVVLGYYEGVSRLDPETIVGRLIGSPEAAKEHQEKWYGKAGERAPGKPGEHWWEQVANGLAQGIPGMMVGGTGGSIAGQLGSKMLTVGAVGAAPFALDTAVTTIPEALAETGDRGKAVLEGAVNAGVTMASFTFLGPLAKLFGKPVAEQLVRQSIVKSVIKGGLNMGAAGLTDQVGHELNKEMFRGEEGLTTEKFHDILANPDKWKERLVNVVPMMLLGMGTSAMHTTLAKLKPDNLIPLLVKEGHLSPTEGKILFDKPELAMDLAKARYEGQLADIKVTTEASGKQTPSLDIRPDVITYEHRKALNFNEAAIDLVRGNILSGKNTVEDVFGQGKVKLALDSRNLQKPESLTDNLSLRNKIAAAQRRYTDEVLSLSSDQNKLPLDQRIVLRDVITDEFNAKMERLTKKDDNTSTGAKAQVSRRIKAKVDQKLLKPTEGANLNEQISKALDNVVAGNTSLTQRETVARLIEHFADQGEAGAGPLKLLEDLHGKMTSDPAYQPTFERVRNGLADTQKFIQDNIVSKLEFNRATKARLQELTKTLPDEKARPLLDAVVKAETKESFSKIALDVFKAQEAYVREAASAKVVGQVKKLKDGPRRDLMHEMLGKLDKSLVETSGKTGTKSASISALRDHLFEMPIDKLQNLSNELGKVVRQAQIERGLYKKALEFFPAEDLKAAMDQVGKDKLRPEYKQKLDKAIQLGKYGVAPLSTELSLDMLGGFGPDNFLRKTLHEDFIPDVSKHLQNLADAKRFVAKTAMQYFGINTETIRGQQKFAKIMSQKTPSGPTVGQTMNVEGLHTDQGRTVALAEAGVKVNGKTIKAQDLLVSLDAKRKAYVNDIKAYFKDNPMVEKALTYFTLRNGYDVQRRFNWWPSSRTAEEKPIYKSFDEFSTALEKNINHLKDVSESANQPFDIQEDFTARFLRVVEQLSLYAELGPKLYRAEKILSNEDFAQAFKDRHGEAKLNGLKRYVNNIYGRLRGPDSTLDSAVSYLTTAWTISKIAWNTASAAKQYLHLLTIFGDGTIDRPALTRALAEQAQFNPKVKQRMRDGSGLAYRMTTGGGFLESQLIFGESGAPSKLKLAQHYGTVFQREANEQVMAVAWRAAEISAKAKGMKGVEAQDYTQKVFELAMGRDQPTNHPLYSSDLELEAKTRPLVRGWLTFMREQNRILNSTVRRVGMAVKNPTQENIKNAGYMLLFGAIGTSIGASAIDSLRKTAYAKDVTEDEFVQGSLKNLVGLWYAGSSAYEIVDSLFSPKGQSSDITIGGPLAGLINDAKNMAQHAIAAADAASEEEFKTGARRGYNKSDEELVKAADSALSLGSGLLGLPFWALWSQGKGLYNWNRRDYILMTEIEQEREKLSKRPNENALRLKQIKTATDKVNEIHRLRERGVLTKERAREKIILELERVMQ